MSDKDREEHREMHTDSQPDALAEMKATYEREPDKWVVYFMFITNVWNKIEKPDWIKEYKYQMFAKKDEHIADAVRANPDIGVHLFLKDKWITQYDFFDYYDASLDYKPAPTETKQDFNGGYIVASQEAYDLLVDMGYSLYNGKDNSSYIFVDRKRNWFYYYNDVEEYEKQFYINNHKLSWDKPNPDIYISGENIGQATDEFMATIDEPHKAIEGCAFHGSHVTDCACDSIQINSMEDLDDLPKAGEENGKCDNEHGTNLLVDMDTSITNGKETISIADEQGKEAHFAKFGFEVPEFECELLKEIEGYIIGYIKDDVGLAPIPMAWSIKTGYCYTNPDDIEDTDYNLTPIQPKWHKDESNFPARVVGLTAIARNVHYTISHIDSNGLLCVEHSKKQLHPENVRLATQKEILDIFYEGKG